MLDLGVSGSRLELDVLNYQFPEARGGEWDAEWLLISGKIDFEGRQWTFIDPCLTTFELAALALWFRGVPLGMPQRELSFTEEHLKFGHVREATGDFLRVGFSQEASPPWASDRERYIDGIGMRIPFSAVNFVDAAKAVEELCRRFPERASRK